MPFIRYTSIENYYRVMSIHYFLQQFPELQKASYGIFEKIHGCNVQLVFDVGEPMKVGKKSRLLKPDEPFFDVWDALEQISDKLLILQDYSNTHKVSYNVYGELFGPGICKGVKYFDKRNARGFRIFDIKANGVFQPPHWVNEFLTMLGIEDLQVPLLDVIDSLEQAIAYPVMRPSRIYVEDGNDMEGIVIKPYFEVFHNDRGTFMLKKKGEKFMEKMRAPKESLPPTEIDLQVNSLNREFRMYITPERLQTIFSHHGKISSKKEMGKYIKYFLDDARNDFLKDNPVDLSVFDKSQARQIFNVGSVIANMFLEELNNVKKIEKEMEKEK